MKYIRGSDYSHIIKEKNNKLIHIQDFLKSNKKQDTSNFLEVSPFNFEARSNW